MRCKLLSLLACLLVGLVAVGCGSSATDNPDKTAQATSEKPPALDDMLVESITKLQQQTSAAYKLQLQVDGKVKTGTDPFPITGELSGVTGKDAITAKGTFSGMGQTATAELRLGLSEVFVNLNGQWFGSEQYGLQTLRERAKEQLSTSAPKVKPEQITMQEVEAAIRAYRKSVLDGTVKAAEVDGEGVWEADLRLNVDGIVALDERFETDPAERLSAKDIATLRKVAPLVRIRYAVGREDGLPRRMVVEFASDDLAAIDPSAAEQLTSVDGSLSLTLSDYGKKTTIERPQDFQPLEQLLGGLLGGFSGAPTTVPPAETGPAPSISPSVTAPTP